MDDLFKNRIEYLKAEITKHNKLYYEQDTPSISDSEYDALFKDEDGNVVEVANTNDECFMKFAIDFDDYKYALSRTVGIKNVR